jgi:signal transduction histidine kinase
MALISAIKLYQQSCYFLGKSARPIPSMKDPKVSLIELQIEKIAKREAMFAPANDQLVRLVLHSIDQHKKQVAQERWMKKATLVLEEIDHSARQLLPLQKTQLPANKSFNNQQSEQGNSLQWLDNLQTSWRSLQQFWWKSLERMDEWADEVSHDHHVSESQAQAMRFESLAEFAAGAGHELNNPLAVIQGRAQQLLAKTQDASSRQALKAIVDQTLRAHRMLRDLIFIARPGRANLAPFRPAEITRSVVRELREEAERRKVTIDLSPQIAPKLLKMETDQLDPDGFRQILLGLGRNAIEASPPDGIIQLHLTQELNIIKIQISDQGHGFSSTDAAHLFDPFYCGRKAGRGLGLGLPRLARVVAQMNGRIRYRSNPGGHGSTFEVILPLPEHPRQASLSHSA